MPVDDQRRKRGGVEGVDAHEVSIRITITGVAGRCRGWQPASKNSMMSIQPPQGGQECASGCPGSGATGLLGRRWGEVQELAHGFHGFGAIGAGEQAVVADTVETLGEEVAEEAADELADVERHSRVTAGSLDSIVLDLERDALLALNAIRRRFEIATRWV